ncbi:unnamed protein product, partial [Closterium sp. NIES-53]
VAVGSGAARGAASGGAGSGGAEPKGAESEGVETGDVETGGGEPRGTKLEGVESGGVALEGAESGGARPQGAASSGGFAGALLRLSPQQLREWFVWRAGLRSGATGAGGACAAGAGGAGVAAGAGVTGGTATIGPEGAHTPGTRAAGTGGVEGTRAGDPTESGATCAGGSSTGGAGAGGAGVGGTGERGAGVGGPGVGGARAGGAGAIDPGGAMQPRPYFVPLLQQSGGLTERREPASPPVSPVRTARSVPRSRPPPVPGTNAMTLRPSSIPLRVPLPAPLESSLPEVPDPDCLTLLLCPLDYATALVAKSTSVGGECALGTDVLEDRQEDFECLATAVPRFASMLLGPEGDPDAPDIPTPRSYAEVITGLRQHQGVDYFQTFSPTPKMTTLRVLLHVATQRDYEYLVEPSAAVYGLRQAPREWHDTLRTTLAGLGFAPDTADPSLFLRTDTLLPPFYVLVYVDDLVFATADTEALTLVKLELQKRHTCTDLGPSALRFLVLLATAHSSVYQPFALNSTFGRVLRRAWGSCLEDEVQLTSPVMQTILGSSCEAEIYAGAMDAQELRLLTYLLTDLGEQPRSPPVLYVDNKAMIALCQEHILEHKTKHIAMRYFVARELQQHGQLRLAYVATRANSVDVFTKALPPGDHQRFVTVLGLVPTLPHLLTA